MVCVCKPIVENFRDLPHPSGVQLLNFMFGTLNNPHWWQPNMRKFSELASMVSHQIPAFTLTLCLTLVGPFWAWGQSQAPASDSPAPQVSQVPRKELVLITDLEPQGASQLETDALNNKFREEVLKTGIYTLVNREALSKTLEEQALQQSGCTTQECKVNLGRILGARRIITGKVLKMDQGTPKEPFWQISVLIVDVETTETLKAESVEFTGSFTQLLQILPRTLAQKLTSNGTAIQTAMPPSALSASPPPEITPNTREQGTIRIKAGLDASTLTLKYFLNNSVHSEELSGNGFFLAGDLQLTNSLWVDGQLSQGKFNQITINDEKAGSSSTNSNPATSAAGSYTALSAHLAYQWNWAWGNLAAGLGFSKTNANSYFSDPLHFPSGPWTYSNSGISLLLRMDFYTDSQWLWGFRIETSNSSNSQGTRADAFRASHYVEQSTGWSDIGFFAGYVF